MSRMSASSTGGTPDNRRHRNQSTPTSPFKIIKRTMQHLSTDVQQYKAHIRALEAKVADYHARNQHLEAQHLYRLLSIR